MGLKMKFTCKWIAAYLLLLISIWLTALPVSAIDYSPIEDFFETMLVDPQLGTSINAADVTIDASQVTIDYTTSASSLIEVGNDIAVVVMFYKKIADVG